MDPLPPSPSSTSITASTNRTPDIPPPEPVNEEIKKMIKKKKKKELNDGEYGAVVSSCSSSFSPSSTRRALSRVHCKRRNPAVRLGTVRRSSAADVDALALPLGMSIAAFVNLVLERKDTVGQSMSVDDLPMICTSAVRESLASVYGDKFDYFARNFERSFGSTLRTLRIINESSSNTGRHRIGHNEGSATSDSYVRDCHSEMSDEASSLMASPGEVQGNTETSLIHQQLIMHGDMNQLACVARDRQYSITNQMTTTEKTLVEQTRSNDLKTLELGLTMRKLRLKETQLALNMESNHLERSKLNVGISKAFFKTEKFKTEVEDTRQAELLKSCLDCLVAGLFIMLASLLYGTYVFSYHKITEATAACMPSPVESSSWWMPKPVASMNSGLNTLKCQVRVVSQMLFGLLIILAITYSIILRSSASKQAMPITFILLLLGILCGFAGKFCVDTLGGSGYHWLLLWEALCLMHLFSNICTSALFIILYGPVTLSPGMKRHAIIPYWARRIVFYAVVLFFLPLFCGLIPFAGLREWKEHFSQLVLNYLAGEGS